MSLRARRVLAISAVAVAAVGIAVLLLVHLPASRARVLDIASGALARRFGLVLDADKLDYNLATLHVSLTGVRLAARGHESEPFFEAGSVAVDLPFAVFGGALAFDRVDLDTPRVAIRRDANGVSNLPAGRGESETPRAPFALDIRALTARGLQFVYADAARGIDVEAHDVSLEMARQALGREMTGPIAIDPGVAIRIGDRRIDVRQVHGTVGFDGSNVRFSNLALSTAEGTLAATGSLAGVFGDPTFDMRFEGAANLERAAAWGPPPVAVGGTATVRGTVSGPVDAPTIDVEAVSDTVRLGALADTALNAVVTITPDAVVIRRATLHEGGGTLDAAARIGLGGAGATTLDANWSALPASALVDILEVPARGLASTLTGRLHLERPASGPMVVEVQNQAAGPATPVRDTTPLSGTLTVESRNGRWSVRHAHVLGALDVEGTAEVVQTGSELMASVLSGAVTVEASDARRATADLGRLGVDVPSALTDVSGPIHAEARLGGRLDAPVVDADVTSNGLAVANRTPADVTAHIAVTPEGVEVSRARVGIGGASLEGAATIDTAGSRLGGSFALDVPDAARLFDTPDTAPVSGPVTGTVTLGGSPSQPDVRVEVAGSGLTAAGQAVDSLRASARVTADRVNVDAVNVEAGGGTLSATGSYAWGGRAYTAQVDGTGLSWTGTVAGDADTTVTIDTLTFAGEGTIARPEGTGHVGFRLSGGTAGDVVQSGDADVTLDGERAHVSARLPASGTTLDGTVDTSAPYAYDMTAAVRQMDLAPVTLLAGLREGGVTGRLSFDAHGTGDAASAADTSAVTVDIAAIDAVAGGVPVILAAPAHVEYRQDDVRVDNLSLTIGTGRLQAGGRLAPGAETAWSSTFDGELSELVTAARGVADVPDELMASGRLAVDWQSTGGLDASKATLAWSGGQVGWADTPPVSAIELDAAFDGTTIRLDSLTGTWQDGGIQGTAVIPRAVLDGSAGAGAAPGHATISVSGLTDEALTPFVDQAVLDRVSAILSASLDADIRAPSLAGIDGTVVLQDARVVLADVDVRQSHPTRLSIHDGRLTLDDVAWTAGGGPLTLTGGAVLDAPGGATLDLALAGDLNLGLLAAFAPTTWTAGSALVDVTASGPASDPDVQGTIELRDGEAAVFNPRLILYDLHGAIRLDNQRVSFSGVSGSLNGGSVRLDGGFGFGEATASGQLIAELQQVAFAYPAGLQSELDGLVMFGPAGDDWQLGGDVRITRSAYTDTISIPALAAARRSRTPVPVAGDEESFLDRLRLNLFVVTEQDLTVDNNYGRIEAGAAVRVVGTAASPGMTGRVTMREGGEVYLAGRTFSIDRGSISFTSPVRIQPEIDIELRTLANGIDVALTLSGTLEQLKTEIRSTSPDRSDRDARDALLGSIGGDDAVTLLSGELLGVTGRAIGLDTLRIERGAETDAFRYDPTLIVEDANTDLSTRLTLSKRIRSDVEVMLSRSLRESGGVAAAVSYNVRPNVELRASQRENTDRSFAVRHEITFGGGTGAPAAPPAAQPRVTAITISGAPGRPEEQVRALLQLGIGDRFAFRAWQQDVDRVKASYTARGYYEARVRPTRTASADNQSVTLDYRIDRGPLTNFLIDGHELDGDLLGELRDAWSRAIFDQFLIDDVKARVLRHLAGESFIGSKVEATVDPSTPTFKQVHIVISTGTQVSERSVRYEGNGSFDAGRLDAVVAGDGLADEIWLDPSQLATVLGRFYREHGYLGVQVKAGTPAVEDGRGVLPVSIEEGPRYTVSSAVVTGVSDRRQPFLDRALQALGPGTPYDAAAVDLVRQRLERIYLASGFNSVRIDTEATADPAASSVAIVFAVEEGVQQVLREVTTDGASRTREGIISSALRLNLGEPVNLTQWAQARKRMYDTNVFAQVDIEAVPLEPNAADLAAGIQPVRAVVRLVEYPAWRLRYGLQLSDFRTGDETDDTRQQGLGVLSDVQNRNLFGRAIAAGAAGRVEQDRRTGTVFLSNGSFFRLPIRSQAFAFVTRQRTRGSFDYLTDRVGFTFEQRWRALPDSELVYAYRYTHSHYYETDPNPESGAVPFDATTNLGKLTAAFLVDKRDDPFAAKNGWFASANWEQAAQAFGSDTRNSKLLVQQYFFKAFGGLVSASRVQVGAAFGSDALIRDDRFFAGGATTVRGYAEDSLGPRDIVDQVAGGHGLLVLNQEIRFPIKGWLNGVGFIDAGNVFASRGEMSLSDLRVGYGFGIRLNTPFAMLRVDFGIPGSSLPGSTRGANALTNGRWYVGIGHIF